MTAIVLQNEECEDLGTLAKAFDEKGMEYEYVRLFDGAAVPDSLSSYRALIILGGPMNVYEEDKYPFLRDEDILIKKALAEGTPILGICLGAQLIAKAMGAKVMKGKQKEIGWFPIKLTNAGSRDEIFKGFEREFQVFQWHGDTFEIPEGAIKLASSDLFSNQAFRIGNAYAFQFHLEVTREMIENWMEVYEDEVASENINPEKILEETTINIPTLTRNAQKLYSHFFKLI